MYLIHHSSYHLDWLLKFHILDIYRKSNCTIRISSFKLHRQFPSTYRALATIFSLSSHSIHFPRFHPLFQLKFSFLYYSSRIRDSSNPPPKNQTHRKPRKHSWQPLTFSHPRAISPSNLSPRKLDQRGSGLCRPPLCSRSYHQRHLIRARACARRY